MAGNLGVHHARQLAQHQPAPAPCGRFLTWWPCRQACAARWPVSTASKCGSVPLDVLCAVVSRLMPCDVSNSPFCWSEISSARVHGRTRTGVVLLETSPENPLFTCCCLPLLMSACRAKTRYGGDSLPERARHSLGPPRQRAFLVAAGRLLTTRRCGDGSLSCEVSRMSLMVSRAVATEP